MEMTKAEKDLIDAALAWNETGFVSARHTTLQAACVALAKEREHICPDCGEYILCGCGDWADHGPYDGAHIGVNTHICQAKVS